MIAYMDGKNSLCSITEFHPKQKQFMTFVSANVKQQLVTVDLIKWVRLLDDAHFVSQNGAEITDSEWAQASWPFLLEFKSGDSMSGMTLGQACSDTGWFLYQPKKRGWVTRYFVPHTAVSKLTVNQRCLSDLATARFREKKNSRMAAILQTMPERYPFVLEQKYERVLNKIVDLWDTPEIDDYFADLMIDKRGGRQGFPQDVAREILILNKTHEMLKQKAESENSDPWEQEQAKKRLSELGISFQAQYFMTTLERGDQATAELFIKGGINVNYVGENGWTPLMIATFNGNENIAKLLIEKGANIHIQDNAGYAPIHWAAFNGFKEVTAILLQKGVNPDTTNRYGWTPLMQAAARGHAEIVQILLNKGAVVNRCDEEGWTPLHKATANGHVAVVKLLLDAGADYNAVHRDGATPLSQAKEKNQTEILKLLLSRGA
jgi:ankyrin repeat protein